MCSGNFKSKCLRKLLDATNEKKENEFVVKVKGIKMKKSPLSTEDKAKNPNVEFTMVEKSLLTKLQLQNMHKKINNLLSSGIDMEYLKEMLDVTNVKMKDDFIRRLKGKKVKNTLLLREDKAKNGFLAEKKLRIMEKPLLLKLQLRIIGKKINEHLGKRQWKKFQKELEKAYGPKHALLPSEGLKMRIKRVL